MNRLCQRSETPGFSPGSSFIHDIPASGQDFNERKANRYLLNPLFTEEEMKGRWQELEKRHGGLFYKARPLAAELN